MYGWEGKRLGRNLHNYALVSPPVSPVSPYLATCLHFQYRQLFPLLPELIRESLMGKVLLSVGEVGLSPQLAIRHTKLAAAHAFTHPPTTIVGSTTATPYLKCTPLSLFLPLFSFGRNQTFHSTQQLSTVTPKSQQPPTPTIHVLPFNTSHLHHPSHNLGAGWLPFQAHCGKGG